MEKVKQTRITSLQKALKVLEVIAVNPEGCGVKEIAYETKINTSSCYHILNTLMDEDYIIKKSDGAYLLGTKIPFLNNGFLNSIKPEIQLLEGLNELHRLTEETVYLLGVNEQHIIMQSIIESEKAIKVNTLYEGYTGRYHARASTRAIIAFWPLTKNEVIFKDYDFLRNSEKTPANLKELQKQLDWIRKVGYSIDEEETAKGVCFIAAPIFKPDGQPIGSYAMSVLTDRYYSEKEFLIQSVKNCAEQVSRLLGYIEEYSV